MTAAEEIREYLDLAAWAAKNCGIGPHGFETGNHCARGTPNPHRHTHGRWRAQDRRRKPLDADHADWIKHWKGERRDAARHVRKERRTLRKEQRAERRTLNRDAKRQVNKLEARHAREAAGSKNPARTAERHQEERQELAVSIREERREKHGEHAEERATRRQDHRDYVHGALETVRTEHAEILRGKREDRRDDEGKAWRGKAAGDALDRFQAVAEPPATLPGYTDILGAALDATGHREAWEDGSLGGREALDLLHAVRLEGRRWLREQAEALLQEIAPDSTKALMGGVRAAVKGFFGKVKRYIPESVAAGVLALAGPDTAWLDVPVVQEAIDEQVAIQEGYLAEFADKVIAESKPLDGNFVANAEKYGAAAWHGAQGAQRGVAKRTNIFNFESREHFGIDPNDLCKVCRDEIRKGRVPIGTLRVIGDSPCRDACHCAFNFYETKNGPEYNTIFAGRGPMDFAVFGRTG